MASSSSYSMSSPIPAFTTTRSIAQEAERTCQIRVLTNEMKDLLGPDGQVRLMDVFHSEKWKHLCGATRTWETVRGYLRAGDILAAIPITKCPTSRCLFATIPSLLKMLEILGTASTLNRLIDLSSFAIPTPSTISMHIPSQPNAIAAVIPSDLSLSIDQIERMASLTMDDSDEERMNSLLTKLFYDMPKLDPMKFNSLLLQTIKSPLIITAVDPVAEFARINVDATSCFSFSKSLMVLFVLAGSPAFNSHIAKLFLRFWLVENVVYPIVPVERTLYLIDRFNVLQPLSFTRIFYLLKRSTRPLCLHIKDSLNAGFSGHENTAILLRIAFSMSVESIMVGDAIDEEFVTTLLALMNFEDPHAALILIHFVWLHFRPELCISLLARKNVQVTPANMSICAQSTGFLALYESMQRIIAESDPLEWNE